MPNDPKNEILCNVDGGRAVRTHVQLILPVILPPLFVQPSLRLHRPSGMALADAWEWSDVALGWPGRSHS